jgi:two-component system sensor histidine kinase KdpD
MLISGLEKKILAAGFNDIASLAINLEDADSYLLNNGYGLKVAFKPQVSAAPVPGGFLPLILLTSLAIIGLFGFALHQWQTMQRAQLLEEEELFFRQTAHDLKTPITIVSFIAETLALKRYKNEEQYRRYLSQLQNETQKAGELFDRLLLSVRLRQHSIDPDLKTFSAETALKALLSRFKPRLQDWRIIEDYRNQNSLFADYDMFERAMINLVENVIRHAAEGLELQLICEDAILSNQPAIKIMIGDRGKNFPMQAQGKIDLLHEALPYKAERGGSGTGLFLVKQIVQTHSGEFYAEKRTDGGIWMVTVWKGEK